LEAWANENPLEVVKRRYVRHASPNYGAFTWDAVDKVRITFSASVITEPRHEDPLVFVVLKPVDALAMADWYDERGHVRSALLLRIQGLRVIMRGDSRLESTLKHLRETLCETTSPQ